MQRSHDSVFTSVGFESGSSTSSYQYGNSSASAMASRWRASGCSLVSLPLVMLLSNPPMRASERQRVSVQRRPAWPGNAMIGGIDFGLSGRRAAVAAASAGLGLASARALAAEGVTVAICGPGPNRVEAAAAEVGGGCIRWWRTSPTRRRRGVRRRLDRGPRRRRHPRHQRRRATGGELRVDAGRRLPGGARPQPDVGRRHGEGRRRPDARPRLGTGRRDHVAVGASADGGTDPLQHRARRRHRVPEDRRPGARRYPGDGQLGAAGAAPHRSRHPALRGRPPPRRASATPTTSASIVAFVCSDSEYLAGAQIHVDDGDVRAVTVAPEGRSGHPHVLDIKTSGHRGVDLRPELTRWPTGCRRW